MVPMRLCFPLLSAAMSPKPPLLTTSGLRRGGFGRSPGNDFDHLLILPHIDLGKSFRKSFSVGLEHSAVS
jgi:hypothetical protein